ncbi:hypothetical protein LshimejAT787_0112240 [Lyophyllum shimeji]|uniref:F-box domain-containing protein n=1 Tax=Lyophyllum shimeji TaxID=47721 RepID=A0A9P3PE48_LYOSH|nr:hypothetical protein LshimejAT787_0112240 [Lyophyllum shimeji]
MSPPQLPLDIFESVIEHLYDDAESLRRCTLVCKSFVVPSRKRLFTRIYVGHNRRTDNPNNLPCKQLYKYLTGNPDIVPYVQELWVDGITGDWVFKEETVSLLLALFAESGGLRVFSIACSLRAPYKKWDSLPILFRQALAHVFHSPQLHTVHFRLNDSCGCAFPIDLFATAPNLKRLALLGNCASRAVWCPMVDDYWRASAHRSRMQHAEGARRLEALEIQALDLRHLLCAVDTPSSPLQFCGLRELAIRGGGDYTFFTGFSRILREVTGSIEMLVWHHPSSRRAVDIPTFQQLDRLRTMVFSITMHQHEYSSLCTVLKDKPFPNTLEQFAIVIEDASYRSIFRCTHRRTYASHFDDFLHCILGPVQHLRGITVRVVIAELERAEELGVHTNAGLRAHFPRLDATGKLSISLLVGQWDIDKITTTLASSLK